jgi:hypothetical protein
VVLTAWVLKVSEPGLRLTAGTGVEVPVPTSDTLCGLSVAVSVIERFAVRVPAAAGVNDTETVQLPPAGTVLGSRAQVVVSSKSPAFAPAKPILVMVSAALPVFVRVISWEGLLVPIC